MNGNNVFMSFAGPLKSAKFLRRTQRFLAEIEFSSGITELVYCPNPGAMTGLLETGSAAILSENNDTKRKRRYTLQAIELNGHWVGTNTHLSNQIVEKALAQKLIPKLGSYNTFMKELIIETGFRVDFKLFGDKEDCLLEVKSATILEDGLARFPDSLTPRGVRQINTLTSLAGKGNRAVLLFLIQRADATGFVVSKSYDLAFANAFDKAVAAGVEVIALAIPVYPDGFGDPREVPYASNSLMAIDTHQEINS